MQFDGAVIKEQGVTFAIAIVRRHVLNSPSERDAAIKQFRHVFHGLPTVLMAQDGRGVPRYYGRKDIVRFLAQVPFQRIPWRRYRLN